MPSLNETESCRVCRNPSNEPDRARARASVCVCVCVCVCVILIYIYVNMYNDIYYCILLYIII